MPFPKVDRKNWPLVEPSPSKKSKDRANNHDFIGQRGRRERNHKEGTVGTGIRSVPIYCPPGVGRETCGEKKQTARRMPGPGTKKKSNARKTGGSEKHKRGSLYMTKETLITRSKTRRGPTKFGERTKAALHFIWWFNKTNAEAGEPINKRKGEEGASPATRNRLGVKKK